MRTITTITATVAALAVVGSGCVLVSAATAAEPDVCVGAQCHPYGQRPENYTETIPITDWQVDCDAWLAERTLHAREVGWFFGNRVWIAQYTGDEWAQVEQRPATEQECGILGAPARPRILNPGVLSGDGAK